MHLLKYGPLPCHSFLHDLLLFLSFFAAMSHLLSLLLLAFLVFLCFYSCLFAHMIHVSYLSVCYRWSEGSCLQWTLRHHMTLLIDNIQYYLQVSASPAEWGTF